MRQRGMFGRLEKIDGNGDLLVKLNEVIDWELFRPELERVRQKERKSSAGRKPYDAVLMLKVLILKPLYNLADDTVEFQMLDRLPFMRFLGLSVCDSVPDAKTVWLFRGELVEGGRAGGGAACAF